MEFSYSYTPLGISSLVMMSTMNNHLHSQHLKLNKLTIHAMKSNARSITTLLDEYHYLQVFCYQSHSIRHFIIIIHTDIHSNFNSPNEIGPIYLLALLFNIPYFLSSNFIIPSCILRKFHFLVSFIT